VSLSVKALIVAGALFNAVCFLFVAILNVIIRPYGGGYLAVLTSLYPGYRPEEGPISIIIGVLYALATGAVAGGLFGWLYNSLLKRR
jgi:hypothetical protein